MKRSFKSRRLASSATITNNYIVAVPLFKQCGKPDKDGVVARHMFAANGELREITVFVGKLNHDKAYLRISTADNGKAAYEVEIAEGYNIFRDTVKAVKNGRLIITVRKDEQEETDVEVEDIWVASTFYQNTKAGDVRNDKVMEIKEA